MVNFREPDFFYRNGLYINNNSVYSYSEPVEIIIEARFSYVTEELLQRVLQEEEEEYEVDITIEKKIINTTQTFKSDECVICLTNLPNILFCNCGHLCLCMEWGKVKSLSICPICKTENTIKRTIY